MENTSSVMKTFTHSQFGILGIVIIDDKEYFPAIDCATMLGYSNPRDAISKHCKSDGVAFCDGVSETTNQYGVTTKQTVQKKYITEGNLYRLIARSKLPDAEKFEHWVFDEVLPSIRKHGVYMTPQTLKESLQNPDALIEILQTLKAEQAKSASLAETVSQQKEQIEELKPKGEYYDIVLATPNLMNITEIAKDYGISPKIFNIILNQLEVIYKNNGRWVLYHALTQEGLAKSNTYTFVDYYGRPNSALNLQWTQKGRLYIYNRLKEVGILPMVENHNGNDDNETVKTAKRIASNTARYKRIAGDTMRQVCEHLEKKTHSQKWFAKQLGISVSTLRSKIDQYRKNPTQETY